MPTNLTDQNIEISNWQAQADQTIRGFDKQGGSPYELIPVYDLRGASGKTWPQWTYLEDVNGFNAKGFRLTGEDAYFGLPKEGPGYLTCIFQKNGNYGQNTEIDLDTVDIPPTMTSGAVFKMSSTAEDNQCSYWLLRDRFGFGDRNIATAFTDRFSVYMKLTGVDDGPAQNYGGLGVNFHLGTYLCADGGCPKEGPGNQHYYHYLSLNPDGWIHIEFDAQPIHQRNVTGGGGLPPQNVPLSLYPDSGYTGYYYNMMQFYMEIRTAQGNPTTMATGDWGFRESRNDIEANQDMFSVTNPWVGYFPGNDKFQISWTDAYALQDMGGENNLTTFQVRWSENYITNNNFSSANLITPEFYTYPEFSGNNSGGIVRREGYSFNSWTQFDLPAAVKVSGKRLYFAIKNISVAGTGNGTSYPFNRPDGKNPPNDYIRVIDYVMP